MKNSTILRMCGCAVCGLISPMLLNNNAPSLAFTVVMIVIMAYGEIVGTVQYKEHKSLQLEKNEVVSSSTTKK